MDIKEFFHRWRQRYLRTIEQYEEQGQNIYCLDETCLLNLIKTFKISRRTIFETLTTHSASYWLWRFFENSILWQVVPVVWIYLSMEYTDHRNYKCQFNDQMFHYQINIFVIMSPKKIVEKTTVFQIAIFLKCEIKYRWRWENYVLQWKINV